MGATLYTAKGAAISIGRQLGRGGEGAVHEVAGSAGLVAKIYHNVPDAKKQAKLSFMASTVDKRLLDYIAWPEDTLHPSRGGPVTGFLMPKVTGKAPLHMVYSPAHRRQDYPNAAWDFLVYVARNIAASLQTLHAHGHVIGDVNQDSVMVGKDSRVVLIDSDSFQVNVNGTLHLYRVGVPFFTPPELQTVKTFDGLVRSPNHDNFGLALLIFHVLFGGRHPFSGVPSRMGVGEQLEVDIRHHRYAYARDCQQRGVSHPPRSIPVSMLPEPVEAMFHLAFTEKGSAGGRPTAAHWVAALDSLRGHLRECRNSKMHRYPDHLSTCPWCGLEQHGVVYFVDLGATFTSTPSSFVLARAWALIEAVPPPPPINIPSPAAFTAKPTPLPAGVPGNGTIHFYRFVVVGIAAGTISFAPQYFLLVAIAAWFGWAAAGNVGSSERGAEKAKRSKAYAEAHQEYNRLVEQARKEAGPEGFHARKSELAKMRGELEDLPRAEKQDLDRLHVTARERQKQQFLDRCYIDSAIISGVGPARKAALRSFGIETAADITASAVTQVRGFGDGLTRAMLDWKASRERRFTFNPAQAVSPSDLNAVRAKYAARRRTLESMLAAAPAQLQQYRQQAAQRLGLLEPKVSEAARHLAQTQADASLLS